MIIGEIILKIYNRMIGVVKTTIWKLLFGKKIIIGKHTCFYPNCKIMIEKNGNIKIGNNCFFNNGCSLTALGNIKIGDNCSFGEGVKIYDHNHIFSNPNIPFCKQGYSIGNVEIGENVWIGSDCIILPNVKIGNNVVIAAGSIITKSIADNTRIVQKRSVTEEKI